MTLQSIKSTIKFNKKNAKDDFKTVFVQKSANGLKNFYISADIKKIINNKMIEMLGNSRQNKEIFQRVLQRSEVKGIKSSFGKYDKNNFYLSILMFLQKNKMVEIQNKELKALATIFKLLGLWKSESFDDIAKAIVAIAKDLKVKFPSLEETSNKKSFDIFSDKNAHDEMIKGLLMQSYEKDLYKMEFVYNALKALFEKIKTDKLSSDVARKFVEFNYLEVNKSAYFISMRKDTIFGSVPQKEINKFILKRNRIEKKFVGEEVHLNNKEMMEKQIAYNDALVRVIQAKIKEISLYLEQRDVLFKEYNFIFEQTARPYLHDKMPLSKEDKMFLALNYSLLLIWAFVIALPISQVFYHAFNGYSTTVLSLKGFKFTFDNFSYLFHHTQFGRWFANTIKIAAIVTLINLISSSALAYALSRFRFKGRKPAFKMLMVINMLPSITGLTTYIVLNALIQQMFSVGPYVIMILVYAGTNLLGFSFVIKNYLDTISKEIDEAAKIDGASNMKVFIKIILPLIAPILGVVALQSFIIPFVDIMMPKFFLSNSKDYTLPLGLTFIQTNPDVSMQNQGAYTAGGLLVAVPMTIVYFASDIFLKQNKAQGAIKG